ncbi:MAG: D-alanyl-D-alanine carboxypeptidase/D-alanyl-D-alanine-endopeptidase [Sutterellaceae bacterium]|nr:D-alanyl-D-alanine carboxypeptidase/D-alanyl-D-alanine-endopeptidase [Sutterellaceae bacterium]
MLLSLWLLSAGSFSHAQALPTDIRDAISASGLPQGSIAIWVAPADSNTPLVSLNAQKPMQPASVIKVVTTAAALDMLKPDFFWNTDFTVKAAPDAKGVVRGMTVRGTGDPHLMIERVWLIGQKLRSLGVRTIAGNIKLDRTAFDTEEVDQGAFDGAATRTYNVGPDALMVNLKTVSVTFQPVKDNGVARVRVTPELDGLQFSATVKLAKGACGDWKKKLKVQYGKNGRVRFLGTYPTSCGEKMWHMAQYEANDYFTRVFKKVLKNHNITWNGKAVDGKAGKDDFLLLREYSEPLPLIVNWINKFSSNPMARQLFLTLSSKPSNNPEEQVAGSLEKSRETVSHWLAETVGADPKTVYIDNGSGLSRDTTVTAQTLGQVLSYMYRSSAMPEFMASLPAAGLDGTMKKRPLAIGSAHVKTGFIKNVRTIAGYATDPAGNRFSVVVLVNNNPLDNAKQLTQDVLVWAASGRAAEWRTRRGQNFVGQTIDLKGGLDK